MLLRGRVSLRFAGRVQFCDFYRLRVLSLSRRGTFPIGHPLLHQIVELFLPFPFLLLILSLTINKGTLGSFNSLFSYNLLQFFLERTIIRRKPNCWIYRLALPFLRRMMVRNRQLDLQVRELAHVLSCVHLFELPFQRYVRGLLFPNFLFSLDAGLTLSPTATTHSR